ncbi:hypothetical protein QWJ34_22520 [Saccharibacillus sp. CPCC 101409]|uniref:hypothetical protein n=1 Tax=Saccharibacillus sp. CPCC 101409 TaxID=3058041 RepID=UPI002672D201|nr:hypothetical protein [Saccharibacillus sp. CPCC 101409]MDO3412557.1 hypothetical protein [Saccharibacillus sp. CPCC 101409]
MNDWTVRTMRRMYAEASQGIAIEDGLVRYDRPGHTRQVAHLPYCHEGRYSAGYYALGTLLAWLEGEYEIGREKSANDGAGRGAVRSGGNADGGGPDAGARSGRGGAEAVVLTADRGLATLRALERLQVSQPGGPFDGAFRWYAEEESVQDSNAAFFILMPLVALRLRAPQAVPDGHAAVIDGMLRRAAVWFERECREPELNYPNKTLSDGAMLLAIADLTGDGERLETAAGFFRRWDDYTGRRGWGWGENMSLVYQGVMLNALEIAAELLREADAELVRRLESRKEELLAILRFYDGEEFVPSIRSYNFGGEVRRPSPAWLIAGVTGAGRAETASFHVNDLPALLLFEPEFRRAAQPGGDDGDGGRPGNGLLEADRAAEAAAEAAVGTGRAGPARQPEVPRILRQRVFDDAYACSWVGRRLRLGSLNRFPVMPGSYQHETWGLGWQSFPLSASAAGGQVSYARWYADDGKIVRTHPAESYKTAYLMPALFPQRPYPEVRAFAAQNGPALLALRVLENVRQPAAEIADEWIVHRYDGDAEEIAGGDGRLWRVLRYEGAAIAISPLLGIRFGGGAPPGEESAAPRPEGLRRAGGEDAVQAGAAKKAEAAARPAAPELPLDDAARRPGVLEVRRTGELLKLRQVLYAGAERTLIAPRLETGWAVVCLDEAPDEETIRAELRRLAIEDVLEDDREVPRASHELIRSIRLLQDGEELVRLRLDPHEAAT